MARLLYVGKARSIRKRVNSHFSAKGEGRMTSRVDRIEFLATSTEAEALLTEQTFIKRHRPRFNIRLRDDKSYPYVCVSLDEDYPRVYFTREKHRPGRAYFGPFSSAKRVRETLDLLGKLFQFRTCEGKEPGRRSGSPCLDYFIKRCGAPCVGYVSREEYRHNIDAIVDFLSGRYRQVEADEQAKMEEAAAVARVRACRPAPRPPQGDPVAVRAPAGGRRNGRHRRPDRGRRRGGRTPTRRSSRSATASSPSARASTSTTRPNATSPRSPRSSSASTTRPRRRCRARSSSAPTWAIAPSCSEAALSERRGSAVEVRVAERGDKRRLRELAERNAKLALDQDRLRREHRRQRRVESLASLREALQMQELPVRIEGFDISNLGGEHTVASMVVFEGGATKKADYRRFRVRGENGNGRSGGPDDFASMEEILGRRMNRYLEQVDLSPHDGKRDASFASLPSLIVIDGGKGQLSAGVRALKPFIDRGVTVIGLAKRLEEVYVPGRAAPVDLAADSEASKLLQRVRDEAHRFAIDHHRGRRDQAMTGSVLDELKGIGPVRKRALLQHFGSPERFVAATREELEMVPGVPGKVAREIHEQLNRTG